MENGSKKFIYSSPNRHGKNFEQFIRFKMLVESGKKVIMHGAGYVVISIEEYAKLCAARDFCEVKPKLDKIFEEVKP